MSHPGHRHTQGCASLVRDVPAWIHRGMCQTCHGHDTVVTDMPAWHRHTERCPTPVIDVPAWSGTEGHAPLAPYPYPGTDSQRDMPAWPGTCQPWDNLQGAQGWGELRGCWGGAEGDSSRVCPGVQRGLSVLGYSSRGAHQTVQEGTEGTRQDLCGGVAVQEQGYR